MPKRSVLDRYRWSSSCGARRGVAFTLVELLIVVVLLGIAGAMVIPAMSQAGVLRIQAAVRSIVSDMVYMQSDALADQAPRIIVFGRVMQQRPTLEWISVEGNGYTMYAPPVGAAAVDLANDWLVNPDNPSRPWFRSLDDRDFGGATIDVVNFDGGDRLIFDDLGGPVTSPDVNTPAPTGILEIISGAEPVQRFRIEVEAYTGRVVVTRLE